MTTIDDLTAMKGRSEKFASITAYDFSFAKLIDSAGIEMVLIGDSLGNVIQGSQHHDSSVGRRDGLPHRGRAPRHRPQSGGQRHALL